MRAILLSLLLLGVARAEGPTSVKLVVLGAFPERLVDAVAEKMAAELPVTVVRGPRVELPKSAYYPPRKRYRADTLLDFLAQYAEPGQRVLGLASVDISTTKGEHKDWGVFGLASMGGPSGVISSHRLRRKAKSEAHVRHRVAVTAVHETGHMLGLPHCPEPLCVMQDAEGSIANTDSTTGALGPRCAARLATPAR